MKFGRARGRTFLVAFMATAGLFTSAAPGLAAEPAPTALPLSAAVTPSSSPTVPAPGDDPDDEPGGSGGWGGAKKSDKKTSGKNGSKDSSKDVETSDETPNGSQPGDPQPIDDDESGTSDGGDYSGVDAPAGEDSSDHFGTKKQTKAEKAAAKKAAQKAKSAQKKAQKKAAAAKKASAKKKQQAAKKMKKQAMRAAKKAAARAAEQRRATADDDRDDNSRSSGSVDSLRRDILDLTNKARKSAGCGAVRYSTQLEKSAQSHANDMSEHRYMSHNDRQGRNSDKRIRATGYNGNKTGENLGEGFDSPEGVFRAWMGSPSHRRNILDCGFKILGVGYSGGYWAQHFGG